MPKKNPKDEADYYYNIARKEEEENETREERAKYKLAFQQISQSQKLNLENQRPLQLL